MTLCRRSLVASALAALLASPARAAGVEPLRRYRWSSRVLVIFAPDDHDPGLARQRQMLMQVGPGLQERDLAVIEVVGTEVHDPAGRTEGTARALTARFGVPAGRFRVVLVGKDGGAKLSTAEPIDAGHLFAVIDAMPMRQDEMRGK